MGRRSRAVEAATGRLRVAVVMGGMGPEREVSLASGTEVVKASLMSGGIRYEGDILSDGNYSFKCHSGTVTLTIPADSAFDLDAKTFSGSISSDFEITMRGRISKKRIQGSVNGGGAEVEIDTFSGSVRLKKK